jgi:hypothetical protein
MMTRSIHLVLPVLLASWLSVLSGVTCAAEPGLYDVEVIVFARRSSEDGERMGKPDAGTLRASGAFPENQFTELSQENYTLSRIRGGLQGYTVLFHRAWRQLAYDGNHAVDYPVHSIATGRNSVEGTVTLTRERFLHLDIDLMLMQADGTAAYRLSEKRRIRSSSDIHYFDHPHLGVIARVTPYSTPDQPEAGITPADAMLQELSTPAGAAEEAPGQTPLR